MTYWGQHDSRWQQFHWLRPGSERMSGDWVRPFENAEASLVAEQMGLEVRDATRDGDLEPRFSSSIRRCNRLTSVWQLLETGGQRCSEEEFPSDHSQN
jgi:hypothetical protein